MKIKNYILLPAILTIVSIGLIGYFTLNKSQSKFNDVIQAPSTVSWNTANWKVFLDPDGKFSYKYPESVFSTYEEAAEAKQKYGIEMATYFYPSEDSAIKGGAAFGDAVFYINVNARKESLIEKYSSEISEYIDSQGRTWVTNGPGGGEGDSSNYVAETFYNGEYFEVYSQLYRNKFLDYLKNNFLVEKDISNTQFDQYEEHVNLLHNILSTFKLLNTS